MTNIGLYVNPNKGDALRVVEEAAQILHGLGAACSAHSDIVARMKSSVASHIKAVSDNDLIKFSDVVISFGGDGTMLNCAHHLVGTDIPIMGFNLGKLGFLAEFSATELKQSLNDLMTGNYRVVDRATIQSTLKQSDGSTRLVNVLNEFVIEKHGSSRMIIVSAFVDQHHIGDYRADGLLLTTPTGSTAYSLSCGGPIITPSAQVFCLTPISPHTLTFRPLIINDTSEVQFRILDGGSEASVVADGLQVAQLKAGDELTLHKSEHVVKLIKKIDSTYFDLLRAKLLWSAGAVSTGSGL